MITNDYLEAAAQWPQHFSFFAVVWQAEERTAKARIEARARNVFMGNKRSPRHLADRPQMTTPFARISHKS